MNLPLEIFGQNDVLSIMNPYVFAYRSAEISDTSHFVRTIESGLTILTAAFPWVAGRITNVGRTDISSGVFSITPYEPIPVLTVKDWRSDSLVPTMHELEAAEMRCDMLKEKFFAPIAVLDDGSGADRSPIFFAQLSFIVGGVILTIMGNHQALDGTGQDQMAFLLNKACKGLAFTDEEVRIGNLRRETILKPFDDDWISPLNHPYAIIEKEKQDKEDRTNISYKWADVIFSATSLSKLKAKVSREVQSGFVSTDDALTALAWQSLARARLARLAPTSTSTIGRAVNPRRYLDKPATYPGYLSNNAFSTDTLQNLADRSLASIATELRSKVDPETSGLGDLTRGYATLLHRAKDKNTLSVTGSLDLDRDLVLSSWAHMRCYDYDFGLGLGLPAYYRRTDQLVVPSLAFFLPKRHDGETVLSICLRQDDLERLRADAMFAEFGRFI